MAALDRIREDKPEVLLGFSEWLADVLDDLAISSQGRLVSEADVDALLRELQDELVRRIMAEGNSWREDEDLRGPTVDLLVRHLLVEARGLFVRRVVGAKWN
jgi:hypothetical protein